MGNRVLATWVKFFLNFLPLKSTTLTRSISSNNQHYRRHSVIIHISLTSWLLLNGRHSKWINQSKSILCDSYSFDRTKQPCDNDEPLEVRRLKTDLIVYYKSLHNLIAIPFNEYFNLQTNLSQTRSGGNLLTPAFCSTNRFANDFFNRAVNCFNSLSVHVISSPTISSVKNALCSIDLSDFIKCIYLK